VFARKNILKNGGGHIQQCIAVSGDERFIEKLNDERFNGIVHSVYRQAVNILATDGDLYSLVTEKLDNAPNTLRISLPGHRLLTDMDIEPGSDVCMNNGSLVVGNITVSIAGMKPWRASLPFFPGKEELALEQNLAVFCQTIQLNGRAGGLYGLFAEAEETAKDVLARLLKERSQCLLRALTERDFSLAYPAGRSLVGLGGGQTPSGDDFCAGLLAVMHLSMGPFDEEFHRFGQYLAGEAKQLTTEISRALLTHAAEGRVREKIIMLLCELTGGSRESTAQAAMQVLHIGSMSGTDLAVGIAAGFRLGINLRKGSGGGVVWR
jgi:hypothetical protein